MSEIENNNKLNKNINIIKNILNIKLKIKIEELIIEFINNSLLSEINFKNKTKYIKKFNMTGKSGSELFLTSYKNDISVLKKYTSKSKTKNYIKKISKSFKSDKNCIILNNELNEIIINFVITYFDKIFNLTDYETQLLIKHTIKLQDYGISNTFNKYFIILPIIGVKNKKIHINNHLLNNTKKTKKSKFISLFMRKSKLKYIKNNTEKDILTNLQELLLFNHLPLLKNLNSNKNNNNEMYLINKYDNMMADKFKSFFELYKLLQDKIFFFHTDIKIENIFIKESAKEDKYNDLEEFGFITNFTLLISDLDKTNIILNNIKILSKNTLTNFKLLALKLAHYSKLFEMRYTCNFKHIKSCSNLHLLQIDFILILIDITIYYSLFNKKYISIFTHLISNFKSILNNNILFDKIIKLLQNFKYNKYIENYRSLLFGKFLSQLCKS